MTPPRQSDLEDRLEEARGLLLAGADADALYARWFHGDTGEIVQWPTAAQYLTATLDPSRFERGWQVVGTAGPLAGGVLVARGQRRLVVAPPDVAPCSTADVALQPGARVLVNPVASAESDGFWHCWSAGWRLGTPAEITRVYCALEPAHALDAAARVVAVAPLHEVWSMKALAGAHRGGRRDGMVIYLADGVELGRGWTGEAIAAVTKWCRPPLPPAVHPVSAGVGWAPDPGAGVSFGQAVTQAVSELVDIATDPRQFVERAIEAVGRLSSRRRDTDAELVP